MYKINFSEMNLEELDKLRKKQLILFFVVAWIWSAIFTFLLLYLQGLGLPTEEHEKWIRFIIIPVVVLEMFIYLLIVFKLNKITSQMRKLWWIPDNERR